MAYTIRNGQSIFDIAVQVYGSIEGVATLMKDNPGLFLGTTLVPGEELVTQVAAVRNNDVVNFLNEEKVTITNSENEGQFTDPSLEDAFLATEEQELIITENQEKILLNL